MSATMVANRIDLPEIYANTDISSPGIAIEEEIPEPTGTRMAWEELLPAWRQDAMVRRREHNISRLPVALLMTRTGSNLPVILATIALQVQKRDPAERRGATIPVPRLIAQVRSSLSLQIKQLAEVLNVERPTIYAWIKEQSAPRSQNRSRLHELYQLAKRWDGLAAEPLGKALTELSPDGSTILGFLLQSEIPHPLIVDRFRAIARGRERPQRPVLQGKKTLSQIAQEHGIDMTRVSQQNDQVDLITGKRVALD